MNNEAYDLVYANDILNAIGNIEEFTAKMEKEEFLKNTMAKFATVRAFEIIGVAAKGLSAEFRKKHSEVEWKEIVGMRDRVAHDYGGVDYEIVWETVKTKLPELKKKLAEIVKNL